MAMEEFQQFSGEHVTFQTSAVTLYSPHPSGAGTKVILGPLERPIELHLRDDYDAVKRELTLTMADRLVRHLERQNGASDADA